jgi:hypothetical protein
MLRLSHLLDLITDSKKGGAAVAVIIVFDYGLDDRGSIPDRG